MIFRRANRVSAARNVAPGYATRVSARKSFTDLKIALTVLAFGENAQNWTSL